MPKYDYRCSAGHVYEKRESFSAPAVQECQVCGEQARRVLTPPAIVFKGSGWYKTDSRSPEPASSSSSAGSSDTSASTAESKAEPAAAPASESKTETKSDSSLPAAAD